MQTPLEIQEDFLGEVTWHKDEQEKEGGRWECFRQGEGEGGALPELWFLDPSLASSPRPHSLHFLLLCPTGT